MNQEESQLPLMDYKGYKELKCYIEAHLLRKFISILTKKFPSHEKFLLTAQIIDSSRSITRNMAEGYGRYTYSDTRNFFIIARGSVTETMAYLDKSNTSKGNSNQTPNSKFLTPKS